MRPTIVYLHGFRSSPASIKARLLRKAVAALPDVARPVLHVPALADRPALAMAAILELVRHTDRSALTFVGSSLGGFYATYAAERLGARAVLVNPAVRPYDDLVAYRGPQVNLYTGATFEVTDEHSVGKGRPDRLARPPGGSERSERGGIFPLSELRALAVGRITQPARYWLLLQTGDEVLDYREALGFYAGAWQYVQGGGNHAFTGFDALIPAILRFAGVAGEGGFVRRN